MAVHSIIKDPKTGVSARVTKYGQLVISPISYSTPVTVDLGTINTAFNFIGPDARHSIVITDIFVSADNGVSNTTPAEIEIYTSAGPGSLVVVDSILQPRLTRSQNVSMTGLNLLIDEGVWVNAKTNDNDILLTIMFYRIPVEDL